MQINLNASNIDPVPKSATGQAKVRTTNGADEGVNFERSDALEGALQRVPAVRAEKVAAAKRAIMGDVMYPPQETIRSIANLLAMYVKDNNT